MVDEPLESRDLQKAKPLCDGVKKQEAVRPADGGLQGSGGAFLKQQRGWKKKMTVAKYLLWEISTLYSEVHQPREQLTFWIISGKDVSTDKISEDKAHDKVGKQSTTYQRRQLRYIF